MQFRASSKEIAISPGEKVGTVLRTGSRVSARRSTSTPPTPKISRAALCLDKILKEMSVSAIGNGNGNIYCEVTSSGSVLGLYFDGFSLYSTDPKATNSSRASALVPLVLHANCKEEPEYLETQKSLEELINAYKAGGGIVGRVELAYFCDCFYYDTKDIIPAEINVLEFDSTMRLQVEQACRSESLTPISACGLNEYLNSTMFSHITFEPPAAASKSVSTASTGSDGFYEMCKEGDFDVDFEWTKTQQERIRPRTFLEKFVPNKAHRMITKLANHDLTTVIDRIADGKTGVDTIQDNYLNIILVGKPGTGKTTTAEALSATLGLPIYTVSLSKNTEEDEVQGKTKVIEGKFQFKETPFLEAYENGGIVVLEEFNLADPGMMQGAIGQAIEYPFVLLKDGYQEVHRHPMCVFISTMNTATQGAREPNEALTSRSPVTIIMEDPGDDEFLSILMSKGYTKMDCERVYTAYKKIITYLAEEAGNEEMVMCVTLRHCLGALKLLEAEFDFKDAINNSMIGSIAIKDLSLADDVRTSVLDTLRL